MMNCISHRLQPFRGTVNFIWAQLYTGVNRIYQIAKQLGYSAHQLVHHFPQECEQMTQRAREYRRQRREKRKAQVRKEVRQAVITLHEQGIFPTDGKVRASLSDPNLMRLAEARITRHAILREIGLE